MKILSAILDLFRATSSDEVWIDQGLPTDRKLTKIHNYSRNRADTGKDLQTIWIICLITSKFRTKGASKDYDHTTFIVTSIYRRNIVERDVKQQTINQSIITARLLVLHYFNYSGWSWVNILYRSQAVVTFFVWVIVWRYDNMPVKCLCKN